MHTTCRKANFLIFYPFLVFSIRKKSVSPKLFTIETYFTIHRLLLGDSTVLGYVAVALGVLRLFRVSDARQNEPLENMDFL